MCSIRSSPEMQSFWQIGQQLGFGPPTNAVCYWKTLHYLLFKTLFNLKRSSLIDYYLHARKKCPPFGENYGRKRSNKNRRERVACANFTIPHLILIWPQEGAFRFRFSFFQMYRINLKTPPCGHWRTNTVKRIKCRIKSNLSLEIFDSIINQENK